VTSFDANAVDAVKKRVKGARIYVEGSLKLDKWTAQDGTSVTGFRVWRGAATSQRSADTLERSHSDSPPF
jgi:single-stranded DNA-binding protein